VDAARESVAITSKMKDEQNKKDLQEFLFTLTKNIDKMKSIKEWVAKILELSPSYSANNLALKISSPPSKLDKMKYVSFVAITDVNQIIQLDSSYDDYIKVINCFKENPYEATKPEIQLRSHAFDKELSDVIEIMKRLCKQCLEEE
jgi:hypothetical protein